MKQGFWVLQILAMGLASFLVAGASFELSDTVMEPNDVIPPSLLPMLVLDPPSGLVSDLLQRYPGNNEATGAQIHSKKTQPSHWILRGIVQEGNHRYALIEQTGKLLRLNVGDLVSDDVTVVEVGETGIKIKELYSEKQVLLYNMSPR